MGGLLTALLKPKERRAHPSSPPLWMREFFGGGLGTATGITVTPEKAMRNTVVFACVSILARTVGSLPLFVYRRGPGDTKERDPGHHLYPILHDQPNRWQTSIEFRMMMEGHLALRGNAYARIVENNRGETEELIPLHPDRVEPYWMGEKIFYDYTPKDGIKITFTQFEILHLRGLTLSSDGLRGLSPIEEARESVGLAMAAEEYGARFFSNDARPGGALSHPKSLKPEARDNLKKSITAAHTGLDNAHKMMVLEEGMSWVQIGMSNEDAQFLETRKYQVNEIARLFNIPLILLQEQEKSTSWGTGVEQQMIGFVVHTIRPWLVAWEQALHRDLLTPEGRRTHYVEFLVDGLLRGDIKSRYEAYAIGRNWSWLSPNEVRAKENMNPIEGGDGYHLPLNMMPLELAGEDFGENVNTHLRLLEHDARHRIAAAREERSLKGRRRLAKAHRRLFAEAAGRVITKEVNAVRRAVKKQLGERGAADFELWLEKYYTDHQAIVSRTMAPSITAYAEGIQAEAAEEAGAEPGMTDELKRFVRDYIEAVAARHVISSKRQLTSILSESPPEEAAQALEARLTEWEEKRPEKISLRETVQGGAAVAQFVYSSAGLGSVWRANPGACPLCKLMDGRKIAVGGSFASEGDEIDPSDGETAPLRVKGTVKHPQLHGGCECSITAG